MRYERKQVVNQYLYLHFPTHSMKMQVFNLVFDSQILP